mmetsp:Transcript_9897/g.36898  ORF Transcript_9897/g.36898 Transcript_9897/m.36898 type:complete len:232 (+) Transcript_9897:2773-3468(+)
MTVKVIVALVNVDASENNQLIVPSKHGNTVSLFHLWCCGEQFPLGCCGLGVIAQINLPNIIHFGNSYWIQQPSKSNKYSMVKSDHTTRVAFPRLVSNGDNFRPLISPKGKFPHIISALVAIVATTKHKECIVILRIFHGKLFSLSRHDSANRSDGFPIRACEHVILPHIVGEATRCRASKCVQFVTSTNHAPIVARARCKNTDALKRLLIQVKLVKIVQNIVLILAMQNIQ